MHAIDQIRARLVEKQGTRHTFMVPEFLANEESLSTRMVDVGDPCVFFIKRVDEIMHRQCVAPERGIAAEEVIYQGFVRSFGSLDGRIGTALTQIAFLPFLRDRLGVTVFLTLPNGAIGATNRKGDRGSPFAVRNPFEVDPSFADPLLPEVPARVQYKALSEACRKLGMRTGSIVPMATLAIDSPLFAVFPELGFWWKASPGEFVFCEAAEETAMSYRPGPLSISERVSGRFVQAPDVSKVRQVLTAGGPHFATDDAEVMLANAFPDVLGGGVSTYTWQDVAAVNYTTSAVPCPTGATVSEHAPELFSWALMPAVMAWRYHEFGERVQLIDVSPSVPLEVLTRARRLAAGWRADFSGRLARLGVGELDRAEAELLISDLREISEREGGELAEDLTLIGEELWQFDAPGPEVDAVVGPLIFCVSAHSRNRDVFFRSIRHHMSVLLDRRRSNPYLAGVANHDTMPAAPADVALLSVLYSFLPGAVPLIFSGTEWGIGQITNKEFGFDTSPELLAMRARLDETRLGLFNDCPVDWDGLPCSDDGEIALVRVLSKLRELRRAIPAMTTWKYEVLPCENGVFGYVRTAEREPGCHMIVVVNWAGTPSELKWTYPEAVISQVGTDPFRWSDGRAHPGSVITIPPASGLIGLSSGR